VPLQPRVDAPLVEHVQAQRQPLHHLPLNHLGQAHRALWRRAVRHRTDLLLVRRDGGGGRPCAAMNRPLPGQLGHDGLASSSSLHRELQQIAAAAAVAAASAPGSARTPARQAELRPGCLRKPGNLEGVEGMDLGNLAPRTPAA